MKGKGVWIDGIGYAIDMTNNICPGVGCELLTFLALSIPKGLHRTVRKHQQTSMTADTR